MTHYYISIQGSFAPLQLALFKNDVCIDEQIFQDNRASSHLIPHIDQLLNRHAISLPDISFIGVDYGPGAFTSLRVIIATVNGLGYARNVPLIGIDGLEALCFEIKAKSEIASIKTHVFMLNAYGGDVYYLITHDGNQIKKESGNALELLQSLSRDYHKQQILFAGNAVSMYEKEIKDLFGASAVCPTSAGSVASVKTIGILAYKKFLAGDNKTFRLVPNYMKTQLFVVKK